MKKEDEDKLVNSMISLHEKMQEQGDKLDSKLSKIFAALHEDG